MPNLLIIDDESSVRSFVAAAMSNRGWTVRAAGSVAAAMLLARNNEPDVVLCDVVMPRQGGAELLREMHSELPHVPVLLMSGHSAGQLMRDEHVPCWWRPVPLLEKPFTVQELEQALRFTMQES